MGNDTGGGLCQFVIDSHPERIGRLVLTNCDAFDKFPPFPFTAVFALLRGPISIKTLFTMMGLTPLRHSPLGFGLLLNDPDPELTKSWVTPCREDTRICRNLAELLRHVAATDLTDVSTRFPQFTKPVTLVWGMRDRCFTPSLARRMAALFPNATMIEVPGAKDLCCPGQPFGSRRRDRDGWRAAWRGAALSTPVLVACRQAGVALLAVLVPMAILAAPRARADSALSALVDALAERLEIAEPVAAYKWSAHGDIEDPVRVEQEMATLREDAAVGANRPGLRRSGLRRPDQRHRSHRVPPVRGLEARPRPPTIGCRWPRGSIGVSNGDRHTEH